MPQLLSAQFLGKRRRPGDRSHFCGQFLARQCAPLQRGADGLCQTIELLDRDPEVLLPQGGPEIAPARPEGGVPDGQLRRREQVQCAAHGPGLDERAVLPQRMLNGPPIQIVDSGPDRQLGGGHELRVQPAQAACGQVTFCMTCRLVRPVQLLLLQSPSV